MWTLVVVCGHWWLCVDIGGCVWTLVVVWQFCTPLANVCLQGFQSPYCPLITCTVYIFQYVRVDVHTYTYFP